MTYYIISRFVSKNLLFYICYCSFHELYAYFVSLLSTKFLIAIHFNPPEIYCNTVVCKKAFYIAPSIVNRKNVDFDRRVTLKILLLYVTA